MNQTLPSFTVRNLGPIDHGEVQLRPLTILVGKNNSGKTYMAQAIYAGYKAAQRVNGAIEPPMTPPEAFDFVSKLRHPSGATPEELIGPINPKVHTWLDGRLRRAGDLLANRLSVYFDVDHFTELQRWNDDASLEVSVATVTGIGESLPLFGLESASSSMALPLDHFDVDELRKALDDVFFEDFEFDLDNDDESLRDDRMARRISSFFAGYLWRRNVLASAGLGGTVHYLPAGRSGLLEAWTDVVRMRLEQERDGLFLSGSEPAALGGIALDFLIELQKLTRPRRRRPWRPAQRRPVSVPRPFQEASSELEELIGGRVVVARGRERVPSLSYQVGRNVIPVQRASSMVAELAPLLSWITELLSPGDLLLIDEPEAHMHPQAVLSVAKALVALSQAGVTVLCTTHSTEFLHQVSNCMLRASVNARSESAENPSIDVADLAVYRFEHSHPTGGTVIAPVEIDPNWGIPEDEYVAVADGLAGETEYLLGRLQ